MKLIYRLSLFVFLLSIPLSLVYAASAPQDLANLLNRIQNLQANFTQTVMDGRGNILQKSSGEMILQRPGRFRWQVTEPSKQLLIADGEHIWFYDVGLQQVMVQKQQTMAANSPAALLSDSPDNLQKQFNVSYLKGAQGFYLTPKDKEALFLSITLIFKQNQLYEMQLTDKLAQQTVINFSQVKLNPAINAQTFHFVVPQDKNIEVVKG